MRFFYRPKRRMGLGKFENGAKYKSVQPMLFHNIKIIRYIIWSYSNLKSVKFPKYSFHQMHCIWKLMALNKNILAYIYTAVFCWWAACWCTNYKLGANIFQAEHHARKSHDNNLQSYDRSYKSDSTPHKCESVYSYSNRVIGHINDTHFEQ